MENGLTTKAVKHLFSFGDSCWELQWSEIAGEQLEACKAEMSFFNTLSSPQQHPQRRLVKRSLKGSKYKLRQHLFREAQDLVTTQSFY